MSLPTSSLLDAAAQWTVLGRIGMWTVLATLALSAVSYAIAEFASKYGSRTALNFFVALVALDGVGVMLLLAGGFTEPFTHIGFLIAAQAALVVLPFVLGGVMLDLAPGAAVVGAIPIAIVVGFLATMELGLVSFGANVRLTVAGILALLGPTVISAVSWQTRNLLD